MAEAVTATLDAADETSTAEGVDVVEETSAYDVMLIQGSVY